MVRQAHHLFELVETESLGDECSEPQSRRPEQSRRKIVLSVTVQGEAGGRGVWGEILRQAQDKFPPAEPREFRSDIFKARTIGWIFTLKYAIPL